MGPNIGLCLHLHVRPYIAYESSHDSLEPQVTATCINFLQRPFTTPVHYDANKGVLCNAWKCL